MRVGLSATAAFTTNDDRVNTAGKTVHRLLALYSRGAPGYQVTVSTPSPTPILHRHCIEPGEDQHNVGSRVGGCALRDAFPPCGAASRLRPRFPSSGSANGLPPGEPGALRRRACPMTPASQ